ncbi:hypothetical protein D3C84_1190120 [compost metagenome]
MGRADVQRAFMDACHGHAGAKDIIVNPATALILGHLEMACVLIDQSFRFGAAFTTLCI